MSLIINYGSDGDFYMEMEFVLLAEGYFISALDIPHSTVPLLFYSAFRSVFYIDPLFP